MQYINEFNKKRNNYNKKSKHNPIKSLHEVESFLNNLCTIKTSIDFTKQIQCIFKKTNN